MIADTAAEIKRISDMRTRVISGFIMVPLLIILYFGGIPLAIAAAIIAYVGVTEFYNGFKVIDVKPSKGIAYVMITLLYAGHFFFSRYFEAQVSNVLKTTFILFWIFLTVTVSLIYNWDITKRKPYDGVVTMTGLLYIALFSYHIVLIDYNFHVMLWLVIFAAFGSDISAYFAGYFFGKRKMAPNLSPKKTIEGAAGGIIGSAVLCGIYGIIAVPEMVLHCVAIGIIGGIAAEAGDLTASAFKRTVGIKDYGNLIPGHGGIMDRFDSVIFVAPVVYYYMVLYSI